ncbi:MAG TPA: biotin/lipoyl-containing protein, partial [Pirellulales bacterium]
GIDVFRIFDPLNSVDNMRVAIDATLEAQNAICETAICYTGDVLNPGRPKYSLSYFVKMAKELEKLGAHFIAIKDMAGLCKPLAAHQLVKALKEEVGIPIHFHTHDSAGIQAASILKAAEAGLDIADCALGPMSGTTSQVNLNSVVEMMKFSERETELNAEGLRTLATYWEGVRKLYFPFETDQKSSSAEVYFHEMPGGQYTNLYQQAAAVGIGDRWDEVCEMYGKVNLLFGDIVKVTPSSKSVGDMAIFMVSNNLQPEDVVNPKRDLAYPKGVIDLMAGRMGYPPGGFPEDVQKAIVKNEKITVGRPGASMDPIDFDAISAKLEPLMGKKPTMRDLVTYVQFPKVFEEYLKHEEAFSDTSVLPTRLYFYGQEPGEETSITIEQGKTLIVKFLTLGDAAEDGTRTAFFELNGQPRNITVADKALEGKATKKIKADPSDPKQLAAPMPGMVVNVPVNPGDKVNPGQKLVTMEAMKMETSVIADKEGVVAEVHVRPGTRVESGDLLIRLG